MPSFTALPGFIGGEEKFFYVRFEEDDGSGYVILDLTGWTYRVDIAWEGCVRICLSESDGIERLEDLPVDDTEFHFKWTLNEAQTCCVPVGRTPVKIYRISPDDEATIDSCDLVRDR